MSFRLQYKIVLLMLSGYGSVLYAGEADTVWSLSRCIEYAFNHNLDIKFAELDVRAATLAEMNGKYFFLPGLSMSVNYGENFGRTINPTTNQFDNTRFSSAGLSASTNVLLFGWFQKRYAAQNNKLRLQSSALVLVQTRYELVLTIATAYLRVLLAKEESKNITFQMHLSVENRERIKKLLESGKSNILEYSQAATQLAADSSAYFRSLLTREQALIDLRAVLNMGLSTPLGIEEQESVPPGLVERPDPEVIYEMAIAHMPLVKNARVQETIAGREVALARSALLPQLSLYASSGTNYSSSYYEYAPDGTVQPMHFGRQLGNNFSQSIGIGLSVPIFNNFSAKQNIANAKITRDRARLNSEQALLKLRQDIYKACQDYLLSFEQSYAAKSAADNAALAFEAAGVRLENGLINLFEYISAKDMFLKLQNEAAALKYDLYFKMLVIEYYKTGKLSDL